MPSLKSVAKVAYPYYSPPPPSSPLPCNPTPPPPCTPPPPLPPPPPPSACPPPSPVAPYTFPCDCQHCGCGHHHHSSSTQCFTTISLTNSWRPNSTKNSSRSRITHANNWRSRGTQYAAKCGAYSTFTERPFFTAVKPSRSTASRCWQQHTTKIAVCVSLGGLFFLAFLAVGLFCVAKKKKKPIMVPAAACEEPDEPQRPHGGEAAAAHALGHGGGKISGGMHPHPHSSGYNH
ncbi:basic proline-rich -like [Olea europaea subsp. europaea]|uniref:Basic proline-rich -like n=1 Tax=Olea europaea subsp. europaea TaxID=158383 RepID=A0A8S0QGI2_OLEEU|nr:basic proline-rich -like [Olea europaea subsp. europaea]